MERLPSLTPAQWRTAGGAARLFSAAARSGLPHQQYAAGFLESTLKQHTGWNVQAPTAWRDRAAKQSGEARLECPPLGDLESVLRPYQKTESRGSISCVRTPSAHPRGRNGLGKTLQVLAFVRSRARQSVRT